MTVSFLRWLPATHRRVGAAALSLAAIAAFLLSPAVFADAVAVVNSLRLDGGCRRASGTAMQRDAVLDRVAEALSRRDRLEDALEHAGYRAATSTAIHVRGALDDTAIRQILSERFCESVNAPQYREVGAYQAGAETWIVLAVRVAALPTLAPADVAERVLELVNAARREPRRCGRRRYEAVQVLRSSAQLDEAALGHARDMAARGALGHEGADGSTVAERVARAGYRWRAVAENVAAGQRDADAVVAAWLDSPGHCANLMGAQYTEMGIAFAIAAAASPAVYWTQVFAAR